MTTTSSLLLSSFFVDQLPRVNESLLNRSLGYSLTEENLDYLTNTAYAAIGIAAVYTGAYLALPMLAVAFTNSFFNGAGYEYKKSLYEYLGIDNYYGIVLDSTISAGILYLQFGSGLTSAATMMCEGAKLSMAYIAHNYIDSERTPTSQDINYSIEKALPAIAQGYADTVTSITMFNAISELDSKIAMGMGVCAGIGTALTYMSEIYWTAQDKPPRIDSKHVHRSVKCICAQPDFIVETPACPTIKIAGNVTAIDEL